MKNIIAILITIGCCFSASAMRDSGMVAITAEIDGIAHILLAKIKDGTWRIMGGGVGTGESFAQSAQRKVFEETAKSIDLPLQLFIDADQRNEFFQKVKPGQNSGDYRLYKIVISNPMESITITENLKKLKIKKAKAQAKGNAKLVKDLNRYTEADEFKWVKYVDLINAIKNNNNTFNSSDDLKQPISITMFKRDWQRLTEAVGFLTGESVATQSPPRENIAQAKVPALVTGPEGSSSSKITGIIAFGDFGTGEASQVKMAKYMVKFCKKNPCDFGITTGDNIYPSGVGMVNGMPNYQILKDRFSDQYQELNIPIYASLGNHDTDQNKGNSNKIQSLIDNQVNFTGHQFNPTLTNTRRNGPFKLWNMPDKYYVVPEKNVLLVAVDTNIFPRSQYVDKKSAETGQLDWLNIQLQNQSNWKIVYGHVPIISHGQHGQRDHKQILKYRKSIVGALCDNKVDFYVSGHDHHLEIDKLKCPDGHLLTAIITGAAGQSTSIPANFIMNNDPNLLWINGIYYNKTDAFPAPPKVLGFAYIAIIDQKNAVVTMISSKGLKGSFKVKKGQALTPKK